MKTIAPYTDFVNIQGITSNPSLVNSWRETLRIHSYLWQSLISEQRFIFYCGKIYTIKYVLFLSYASIQPCDIKYIHIVLQSSPPSISRTFHLPNTSSVPMKHEFSISFSPFENSWVAMADLFLELFFKVLVSFELKMFWTTKYRKIS